MKISVVFAAILTAAVPAPRDPLACDKEFHEHGGVAARAHSDHRPKHGGVFFMAPNGRNHLEGVVLRPGILKVYLYDEYTQPLPAASFKATLAPRLTGASKRVPFTLAGDGTLVTSLATPSFPLALDVWITFPRTNGVEGSTDLFTFEFERFTDERAGVTSAVAAGAR